MRRGETGQQGFTLIEVLVAALVSTVLMLGMASLTSRFFRSQVRMDRDASLRSIRQLALMATSPGGAPAPGTTLDSCSQTFANRTIQWVPGPPNNTLQWDNATPLSIRFAGDTILRGPQTGLPDFEFEGWRVTAIEMRKLKCVERGTNTDCLTGTGPTPNKPTDFFAEMEIRLQPSANMAANNGSRPETLMFPIKLFSPGVTTAAPTTYVVSGCEGAGGAGLDVEQTCLYACIQTFYTMHPTNASSPPYPTPTECFHQPTGTCHLTRRICDVLNVPIDLSSVPPPVDNEAWTFKCDFKALKQKLFLPAAAPDLCSAGPPPTYLQGFNLQLVDPSTTNFVCQKNAAPTPADYCQNCYLPAPMSVTSPGQISCHPGGLTQVGDIVLPAFVRFGTASGSGPTIAETTCGFAPTDPPVNLCSGTCNHGPL